GDGDRAGCPLRAAADPCRLGAADRDDGAPGDGDRAPRLLVAAADAGAESTAVSGDGAAVDVEGGAGGLDPGGAGWGVGGEGTAAGAVVDRQLLTGIDDHVAHRQLVAGQIEHHHTTDVQLVPSSVDVGGQLERCRGRV